VYVSRLADVMRAAMAILTVNGISCAKEGHRSVQGVEVQSSAAACRQCHAATTSNTSSARSAVSHFFVVPSESWRVGRIVDRAMCDLVVDNHI